MTPPRDISGVTRDFTPAEINDIDKKWKSAFELRLSALEGSLKRIEDIFSQAQGALVFVKWSSAVMIGCAAAWAWLTTHFTPK